MCIKNMIGQMLKEAAAYEESGQLDLALRIYNVALELLPDAAAEARAKVLLLRGHLNYRLKNPQGAMDDLRQALDLDATLAEALTGEFSKFYKEGCH